MKPLNVEEPLKNKVKTLMSELDKSNVQLRTFFVGSKKLENILGLNKSVKNMGDLGNCEILMSLTSFKTIVVSNY